MLALLTLPQYLKWHYVEYWVIAHEWPVEHGWVFSSKDGIIDPTFALFGFEFGHACYFSGASFPLDDVRSVYLVDQLRASTYLYPTCFDSTGQMEYTKLHINSHRPIVKKRSEHVERGAEGRGDDG